MVKIDEAANEIFEDIDTNQDGIIDKNELRKWVSNAEAVPSSSYESSTSGLYRNDNTTSRFDRNRYASYGTTAAGEFISDAVIHTSSAEETNEYLERSGTNIYKDRNPQIIRRGALEAPITYEQRILVRYLQPPDVPPPGPLIIKEVRPPQSPPPPPLVIRQHAPALPAPPPIILRERPPTPPPYIPSETVVNHLPALPAPPRSVVIERFPPLPEKPRDIVIERWLPYGPPPERQRIVQRAPPPLTYAKPSNKIIIYEGVDARVVRQFKKLDVIKENPADYVARYGSSLLDSATLVQQARNVGVYEDISPPVLSSRIYTNVRGRTIDSDLSSEVINRGFSFSDATTNYEIKL